MPPFRGDISFVAAQRVWVQPPLLPFWTSLSCALPRMSSARRRWRIWLLKPNERFYISLIGAPSQLDLFDYKPALKDRFKEDIKDWLKSQGERLTGMTANQAAFPLAPSLFKFQPYGRAGTWISELLHGTAKWWMTFV
jgi:hypothetical protein